MTRHLALVLREKAEKDKAERERAERAAKELAKVEKAEREKAEREAKEQEKEQREAKEREAKEQAHREKAEREKREKAEREAKELARKEEQAARKRAEKEAKEREERVKQAKHQAYIGTPDAQNTAPLLPLPQCMENFISPEVSDLAFGALLFGLIVAAVGYYKGRKLRKSRKQAMSRSLSCPGLVELKSARALEACAEMFSEFEERSGKGRGRKEAHVPTMPVLPEMLGEWTYQYDGTSNEWTPRSTPRSSPRSTPRQAVSPRSTSPRQSPRSLSPARQPTPDRTGGGGGADFPAQRQSSGVASPRSSPPPDIGELERECIASEGAHDDAQALLASLAVAAERHAERKDIGTTPLQNSLIPSLGLADGRASRSTSATSTSTTSVASLDEAVAKGWERRACSTSSNSQSRSKRNSRDESYSRSNTSSPAPEPALSRNHSSLDRSAGAPPPTIPPRPHVIVLGDAGVGKTAVVDVIEAFAINNDVELCVLEGKPHSREALFSATPLVVWDALGGRGALKDYVARHLKQLTCELTTPRERDALASRLLVLCNKTDKSPCPLPEFSSLAASTRFLAGSATRGTNMRELWRLIELCAAPRPRNRHTPHDHHAAPIPSGSMGSGGAGRTAGSQSMDYSAMGRSWSHGDELDDFSAEMPCMGLGRRA